MIFPKIALESMNTKYPGGVPELSKDWKPWNPRILSIPGYWGCLGIVPGRDPRILSIPGLFQVREPCNP